MKLVFILSCLLHLANVLHVAKAPTCHLPLPNCRATERVQGSGEGGKSGCTLPCSAIPPCALFQALYWSIRSEKLEWAM